MADTLPSTAYSKDQHDTQVDSYKQYENLPLAILEHQLHEAALGDCKGLTVLDLGGGQGLRARQIIDHGAAAVDVVDREWPYSHNIEEKESNSRWSLATK